MVPDTMLLCCVKMLIQGVEKIMSDIPTIFKSNGWSETSTDKMLTEYNGEGNHAKLGITMLEIASVADWVKIFA